MSHPEAPREELDPTSRFIELSLDERITKSSINRIAMLVARYLYVEPKMNIESFSYFGTRTFVMVEIKGDKELNPDGPLAPGEAKLRSFIRDVVPAAETPHQWLFASVGSEDF